MDALAEIERIASQFSGTIRVAARHLGDGREVRYNDHEIFPAASTIKVPVMVEVFRQVEAGRIRFDDRVPYDPAQRVRGSGVLRDLDPGLEPSVRDLVTLMIVVSDNTATNMLLDLVGVEAVNAAMREMDLGDLVLHRKIAFDEEGSLADATPAAFLDLLCRLAAGEVVSAAASRAMIEVMLRQQYTDVIGRYIPYDADGYEEDPEHALGLANKTRSVVGVRNDVGIVFLPEGGRYALALMSKGCADARFWVENEAKVALAKVSRVLYDAFTL